MTARLSIRWKLTAWYAALLAVALGLFSLGLYAALRTTLQDNFNEQVQGQAELAAASVQIDSARSFLDQETLDRFDDHEQFIQLIDRTGTVPLDTSDDADDDEVSPVDVSTLSDEETHLTRQSIDGTPFVIATTPVRSGDQVVAFLRLGASREDVDETLQALLISLGIATPIVLILATVGGYLLAGRALSPVAAITDLAAGIDGNDLQARLNLSLPDDELGRLAQTFDGMLTRIAETFERQRRFTGDAAHELRTPLSLMRSQVDLTLARPRTNDEYREALVGFETDIDRMTALVGTLLTLARADEHRLPVNREKIDLTQTIDLTLEQFSIRADDLDIRLCNESNPTILSGDEDLLIQVLVNLVDNALAHTPSGGVVAVGCRSDAERVHLWVADTGRGVAAEHQPRIFDRFYRTDSGRTRSSGGTGLGLSICKAIVRAHGGTIGLESSPGEGTRVQIDLPRASI